MSRISERVGNRHDPISDYYKANVFGERPGELTLLSLLPPVDRCLVLERVLEGGKCDLLACIDKLSMAYYKAGWPDVASGFLRGCATRGWLGGRYRFFAEKLNGLPVDNVSRAYDDTLQKLGEYDRLQMYDTQAVVFSRLIRDLCVLYRGREIITGHEAQDELDEFIQERRAFIANMTRYRERETTMSDNVSDEDSVFDEEPVEEYAELKFNVPKAVVATYAAARTIDALLPECDRPLARYAARAAAFTAKMANSDHTEKLVRLFDKYTSNAIKEAASETGSPKGSSEDSRLIPVPAQINALVEARKTVKAHELMVAGKPIGYRPSMSDADALNLLDVEAKYVAARNALLADRATLDVIGACLAKTATTGDHVEEAITDFIFPVEVSELRAAAATLSKAAAAQSIAMANAKAPLWGALLKYGPVVKNALYWLWGTLSGVRFYDKEARAFHRRSGAVFARITDWAVDSASRGGSVSRAVKTLVSPLVNVVSFIALGIGIHAVLPDFSSLSQADRNRKAVDAGDEDIRRREGANALGLSPGQQAPAVPAAPVAPAPPPSREDRLKAAFYF